MQRLYLVPFLVLLVGCSLPVGRSSTVTEQANPPVVLTSAATVETAATSTETIAAIEEAATAESTTDSATAQDTTPILVPTDTPLAAATPQTDWLTTVTVEGDFYILGNPNAPIRLIDYSDFL